MRVRELINKLKEFDEDMFIQIRKPNKSSYREITNIDKYLNSSGTANIIVIEYRRKNI